MGGSGKLEALFFLQNKKSWESSCPDRQPLSSITIKSIPTWSRKWPDKKTLSLYIEQTPSSEMSPDFSHAPFSQPRTVKRTKDRLEGLPRFKFPNFIQHLSVRPGHRGPSFYSLKLPLLPKTLEPLLKGSWQWMGFLTVSLGISSLSCLGISFVFNGPKFGGPGWYDASRCQEGPRHCWCH